MSGRAIILAAGRGERLAGGVDLPKPLKPVAGVPLIVRVLRNLERAGIREVGVVVGYRGDSVIEGMRRHRVGVDLQFVANDEYDKPNGTSLLKASRLIDGPTYVLMSDHLWSPGIFEAVSKHPLRADEAVLGVDYRIERCFDLDDATKVRVEAGRIVDIGKQLRQYDALDTGVFRITPALVDALREAEGPQGCSLSQGVAALARKGKMGVADVGDSLWVDVDTPEAHAEAERLIARHGDALLPTDGRAAAQL